MFFGVSCRPGRPAHVQEDIPPLDVSADHVVASGEGTPLISCVSHPRRGETHNSKGVRFVPHFVNFSVAPPVPTRFFRVLAELAILLPKAVIL